MALVPQFLRRLLPLLLGLATVISATAADLRVVGLAIASSGSGSIRLELLATVPVVAVQVDLLYPAGDFVLGAAIRGAALRNHVLKAADVAPGRHRFLIYSTANQPLAGGVLAELPLAHVGTTPQGTFPLLLTNAIVATPAGLADLPLNLFSSELIIGNARPPVLSGISVALDGKVRFTLEGADGRAYQIQGSPDLRTWTDLQRRTVTAGRIVVDDLPEPQTRYRFYRARLLE